MFRYMMTYVQAEDHMDLDLEVSASPNCSSQWYSWFKAPQGMKCCRLHLLFCSKNTCGIISHLQHVTCVIIDELSVRFGRMNLIFVHEVTTCILEHENNGSAVYAGRDSGNDWIASSRWARLASVEGKLREKVLLEYAPVASVSVS
jgi:hypothetical protein